jgi:hypothetical protein
MNGNKVANEMRSNKNIIKMKIVWKVSCARGCDRNKTTITDNNTGRGGRKGS